MSAPCCTALASVALQRCMRMEAGHSGCRQLGGLRFQHVAQAQRMLSCPLQMAASAYTSSMQCKCPVDGATSC